MKRIINFLIIVSIFLSTNINGESNSSLKQNIVAYTDNSIITSFAKNGKKLWIGSYGELRLYDLEKRILLKRYKFAGDIFLSKIYQIKIMAKKIWVATDIGLFSLDEEKNKWDVFFCGKELPKGEVEAMDADPNEKGLWLGVRKPTNLGESGDIRLGYFELKTKQFKGIKINSGYVNDLVVTKDDIWFLTGYFMRAGRLIKFNKKIFLSALTIGLKNEDNLSNGREEYTYDRASVSLYKKGELFVFNSIVISYSEEKYKYFLDIFKERKFLPLSLPSDTSALVKESSGNNLWIYGNKKLYVYTENGWQNFSIGDFLGKSKLIGVVEYNGIYHLIINSESGSKGTSGIYTFSGEKIIDLAEYRELAGNRDFTVLFKDSYDNIWIKSDNANGERYISKFNEKINKFEYINCKVVEYITKYLNNIMLWVPYMDYNKQIFVLRAFKYDQKTSTVESISELDLETNNSEINLDRISFIKETEKNIWIISADDWVACYDKNKKIWSSIYRGLSNLAVFDNNGIWFAIRKENGFKMAFLKFDNNELSFLDFPMIKLESNYISAIIKDKNIIWLSSGRSLVQADINKKEIINMYYLKEIGEYGVIKYILPYKDKYLILGIMTYEDTEIENYLWLFDMKTGKYFNTNISQYLKGISLYCGFYPIGFILDNDNLWLGCSHGLFKIDMEFLLKSSILSQAEYRR